MRKRTAIVVRSSVIGFAVSFGVACLAIIVARPVPPLGILAGQINGALLGGAIIGGAVGLLRARSVPESENQGRALSRVGVAALGACVAMLAMAMAATAVVGFGAQLAPAGSAPQVPRGGQ